VGGIESTVLDVSVSPPCLLRPGLVTPADLEAVIGAVQRLASGGCQPPGQSHRGVDTPRSPGMMARHYAPRTPLELSKDGGGRRVEELLKQGRRIGWLALSEVETRPGLMAVRMPNDPGGYA